MTPPLSPNVPETHRTWWQTWQSLLRHVGSQASALRRSCFSLLLAAVLQGGAFACLYPIFTAVLQGEMALASHWMFLITALSVCSLGCRWYGQGFEFNGNQVRSTHELRLMLGEQLRRVPLQTLQQSRSGEMNALLLGSVDENMNYTVVIFNVLCLALITPLVVALVTLLFVDWRLGLLLLVIFPLLIPLYRWRRPAFARQMHEQGEIYQQMNADIVEYLQGQAVIRASGCCQAQPPSQSQASSQSHTVFQKQTGSQKQASSQNQTGFQKQTGSQEPDRTLIQRFQQLEDAQTRAHRQGANANILIASIIELGLLVVVFAGIGWVVSGTLDLALIGAVMVMITRFSEPMATFVSYTAVLELIDAALIRIEALLAIEPLPQPESEAVPASFEIAFEQVSFRYQGTQANAITDLSFTLPERGMTALVGPSGAGKTTVTKLLMRYADPQQGQIRIGGVDLRAMTSEQLNRLISVVFQEVYLFNDTLLANLLIARPDATMAEVEDAARAAQCLDFIARLPQGWQTPIGEMGARLSGGEQQRISIARALLKNAPIVILDEPTAALDIESELAVQRAIDHLVQDRTVLIIAHRLTTIAAADRIFVIDDGQLKAQGSHEALLASGGAYDAMWQAQQSYKYWRGSQAEGVRESQTQEVVL